MTDHSASRHADVLAEEAPHLIEATTPASTRRRALEEIVEITVETQSHWPASDSPDVSGALVRIRELARHLHALEPVERDAFPRITGDPEHDNAVRSRAAVVGLAGWPHLGDRDLTDPDQLEEALSDFVCDLLHLGRRGGASACSISDRAWRHFTDEEQEAKP